MTQVKRAVENSERRCRRCDDLGWKRRPAGRWVYCMRRDRWFPDGIDPGDQRCPDLTIDGVNYGEGGDFDL